MIYSLAAGGTVSISALFIAGVLPGLLLRLHAGGAVSLHRPQAQFPKGEVIPFKQAIKICIDALWG